MNKLFLAATLAFGTTFGAQAADANAPIRFLAGFGMTYGGDTLVTVPYTDGTTDNITAGGLFHFYAGGEYRASDRVALQATLGYHSHRTNGSDGSVRFDRVPVDLLAMVNVTPNVRIGGGAQIVLSPQLKGTGVVSNVNVKFKNTVGGVVEGEYVFAQSLGLKLRYVAENFRPKNGGETQSGNHVGVMLSYYF